MQESKKIEMKKCVLLGKGFSKSNLLGNGYSGNGMSMNEVFDFSSIDLKEVMLHV